VDGMTSLAWSVVGNAVWAALLCLLRYAQIRLERRHPFVRIGVLAAASLVFVAVNLFFRWKFSEASEWFFVCSFALLAASWWFEIRSYWRLGIVGIGATKGTDRYTSALEMCSNSLDFLGVGARKLTDKLPEFEDAINRCHRQNRAVRLLLSSPNNPELIAFARQAMQPPNEYQERVRASLRLIRLMKVERALNVEVRFYDHLPVFRLMFINDDLCLASHYVFGEGDGSQLPDIYVRRRTGRRDVESIYYGFQQYFEQFWKSATPWDFESYMERE